MVTTNSQKTKVNSNFPNLDAISKSPIAKNNFFLFWSILKFIDTRNFNVSLPFFAYDELSGVITEEKNVCLERQG